VGEPEVLEDGTYLSFSVGNLDEYADGDFKYYPRETYFNDDIQFGNKSADRFRIENDD
jgi:hypothetical protein